MMKRMGPDYYRDMPWKNGGGVTRELCKLPHPSDPARFLARLSIATVAASGPFSVFPGVDRVLMLLEGEGLELLREGLPPVRIDTRWRPHAFPGDVAIDCELLGQKVRDFNLMVDRALLEGSLEVVRLEGGETRTLPGADTVYVYGLEGRASLAGEPVGPEELLELESPRTLELKGAPGAALAVIRLRRRG